MEIDREKIIEHIEATFLYLGCANIDTSEMDGAIPIDAVAISDKNKAIGVLDKNPMASGLKLGWNVKTVHFNGENLELMTCTDMHWSRVSSVFAQAVAQARMFGDRVSHPDFDCYSQLYYSRINKFGVFEKFPIEKRRVFNNGMVARRTFNPWSLFAYKEDVCRNIKNESDDLAKEIRATEANLLLAGIAVGMRGNWSAKVKIAESLPSLTVLTDPIGVKELWKLRDIPDGKKRRAALLHWVAAHWRQQRHDPEVETYVRKQLRGATTFRQGELSVEVKPSEIDSIELDFARRDREALRAKKEDRRKRQLRLKKSKTKSC